MKKLLVAGFFTLFSVAVPLVWAQAVAQETERVVMKADDAPVQVEISGLSDTDEERIEAIIDGLGEVFGEKVRAKLEVKLSELDDIEREALADELDGMFDGNGIQVHTGGLGILEALVALTAISLTLGLPVIILLLVFIFSMRKRRQMMELTGMYVKADKEIPAHVMAEFGTGMTPEKRLRTGLHWFLVGLALVAVISATGGEGAATLGLIPAAIGLARILYWWYESRHQPPTLPHLDNEL